MADGGGDGRSELSRVCVDCGCCGAAGGVGGGVCARCKNVWYCGPKCQRAAWTTHKAQCVAAARARAPAAATRRRPVEAAEGGSGGTGVAAGGSSSGMEPSEVPPMEVQAVVNITEATPAAEVLARCTALALALARRRVGDGGGGDEGMHIRMGDGGGGGGDDGGGGLEALVRGLERSRGGDEWCCVGVGSLVGHSATWRAAGGSAPLLARAAVAATARLTARAAAPSPADGAALALLARALGGPLARDAEGGSGEAVAACVAGGLWRALARLVVDARDGSFTGATLMVLHALARAPCARARLFEEFVDHPRVLRRCFDLAAAAADDEDVMQHAGAFVNVVLDGAAPGGRVVRSDTAHNAAALVGAGAPRLLLRAMRAHARRITIGASIANACGVLCGASDEALVALVAGGALQLVLETARALARAHPFADPGAPAGEAGFVCVCIGLRGLLRESALTAATARAFVGGGGGREIAALVLVFIADEDCACASVGVLNRCAALADATCMLAPGAWLSDAYDVVALAFRRHAAAAALQLVGFLTTLCVLCFRAKRAAGDRGAAAALPEWLHDRGAFDLLRTCVEKGYGDPEQAQFLLDTLLIRKPVEVGASGT